MNGPQTFRIALHHDGTDAEADAYCRGRREDRPRGACKIFGELPKFDGGIYTFLADYLPWVDGDGMEHRNSTVVSRSRRAAQSATSARASWAPSRTSSFTPGTWSGSRAKAIEPFDFEEADVSDELWFGEGFTNYFDGLILERAGL